MSDEVATIVETATRAANGVRAAGERDTPAPAAATKQPLSLDERIAWTRCLSALSNDAGRDPEEWQAEVEAVLAVDEVFAPLRQRLKALRNPASGQEGAPPPATINQRLRGIVLAAMRLVEARPITSISEAMSRNIKSQVDDYAWKSGPVQLLKWLLPLLGVFILGGTAFGVWKVDGALTTLNSAAEDARRQIKEKTNEIDADASKAKSLLADIQVKADLAAGLKPRLDLTDNAITTINGQVSAITTTLQKVNGDIDGANARLASNAKDLSTVEIATRQLVGFRDTAAALTEQPAPERSEIVTAALVLAPFVSPFVYGLCGVSAVSLLLSLWVLVLALRGLRKAREGERMARAPM